MHRRLPLLAILILMALTISAYVSNYMTTYALTSLRMATSKPGSRRLRTALS